MTGLDGVVAAETRVSHVDGENGRLLVRGVPVTEFAGAADFEETAYLLWNGRLPDRSELSRLRADLAARRSLRGATLDQLRVAARADARAVDALLAVLPALGRPGADPEDLARNLLARVPTAVATYRRLADGREPVEPPDDLRHAACYLATLEGSEPDEERVTALETYMNAIADHGLNASTFAARVVASTGADLATAATAAVCALAGSLHGGGPAVVLDILESFAAVDDLQSHLEARFEAGRAGSYLAEDVDPDDRLIGFGHRVYDGRDPRAEVLAGALEALDAGERAATARRVEQVATDLLARYESPSNAFANVGFFTPVLLEAVGLAPGLFAPTFAVARVAGWTAHALEQRATGHLLRPRAEYVGRRDAGWVPLEER